MMTLYKRLWKEGGEKAMECIERVRLGEDKEM